MSAAESVRSNASIRKGDQVRVMTGRDKGKVGRVLSVHPAHRTVTVEHANMIKRHTRPNPAKNIKGGIVERESSIHASNVQPLDPETGKPTRVGRKVLEDGRRVRVSRRSGSVLDK